MSYLRYLCYLANSGDQYIFCWFFGFVLVFLWGFFVFLFLFVLRLVRGGVLHIVCCVLFCCLRLESCVPNVGNFSGLSILDCPFGFTVVYLSF